MVHALFNLKSQNFFIFILTVLDPDQESVFPIRIRIQEIHFNTDPRGFGSGILVMSYDQFKFMFVGMLTLFYLGNFEDLDRHLGNRGSYYTFLRMAQLGK